jgi:hypothetical protein
VKVGRKYQQVDIHIAKNDVFKPRVRLPESIARRVPREADAEARLKALQARDVLADIGWTLDPDATVKQYGRQRVIDIVRYARSLQRKAEATGRPIFNLPGSSTACCSRASSRRPPSPSPAATSASARRRSSVAASINDSFQQHRRQRAQAAWDDLSGEQQELVRTLMQATLHRFTLERIERDGWQGALFEISRLDVMQGHGFLACRRTCARRVRTSSTTASWASTSPTIGARAGRARGRRLSGSDGGRARMCGRYTLYHDETDLTGCSTSRRSRPWRGTTSRPPRRRAGCGSAPMAFARCSRAAGAWCRPG